MKGCAQAFGIGILVIAIATIVGSALSIFASRNTPPTPTPVPITKYCIDQPGVSDAVALEFLEKTRISNWRDIDVKYRLTARPSDRNSSEEFKANFQQFTLRFSAQKPGTGKYKTGSFHVHFDDEFCLIHIVDLNW